MNIYLRELRSGLKPFIFWTLGLCLLVMAGVAKFQGLGAAGESMRAMLDSMPKIMLAAFGMSDTDIFSFPGYFAILAFFALVCAAIYAVYLGNAAVSRESVDKTVEFIFTKPRSRAFILTAKLTACLTYLAAFCVAFCALSFAAVQTVETGGDPTREIILYSTACFVTGLVFFAVAALFSAAFTRAETGSRAANLAVLAAYGFSVVYDMLDNGTFIRPFAVFKYFPPNEMTAGQLSVPYLTLALAFAAAALVSAYILFEKRDINYA